MEKVDANHELIETVGKIKCSSLFAMINVNNDVFCVKSLKDKNAPEGTKYPVVLHIIRDFTSNKIHSKQIIRTDSGSTLIAEHANSITYHAGVFYMTTGNAITNGCQVVSFGENGIVKKHIGYKKKIYSINYYDTHNGNLRFLVSIDHDKDKHEYSYHLVRLSGTKFIFENVCFTLKDGIASYNTGNDSFYDQEHKSLYTTMFVDSKSSYITKNLIYQYDLGSTLSGRIYVPARAVFINAKDTEQKFEIEGMFIKNSRKYVCANVSPNDDGVFVIAKK